MIRLVTVEPIKSPRYAYYNGHMTFIVALRNGVKLGSAVRSKKGRHCEFLYVCILFYIQVLRPQRAQYIHVLFKSLSNSALNSIKFQHIISFSYLN